MHGVVQPLASPHAGRSEVLPPVADRAPVTVGTEVPPAARRVGTPTYCGTHGRPVHVPPGGRLHPGVPGRLQVPRPQRPRHLRRQGQEPPPAAEQLLRRRRGPAPAYPPDGDDGGERRVDRRRHRGRGPPARVQLDQGVRSAVQRPLPRRQELPEPGRDAERGVPAPAGHARPQAQGRPLLRPVRARLGDPRDARHPHPRLPGPHVLQRRLQARRPDRAALPARLHRQVRGPLRRPGERRRAPPDRRRLLRLHGRQDRPDDQAPRARDGRGQRGAGVREGRAAARRPRRPQAGHGEAGRRPR